jgi:hypothetical protein
MNHFAIVLSLRRTDPIPERDITERGRVQDFICVNHREGDDHDNSRVIKESK